MLHQLEIACFGASDKGDYAIPYPCHSLPELLDNVGHPLPGTLGIYYAIQALHYHQELIFIRVESEGYALHDYHLGLRRLLDRKTTEPLAAICIPGVGSEEIIEVMSDICLVRKSLLITTEADLYDYLTEKRVA